MLKSDGQAIERRKTLYHFPKSHPILNRNCSYFCLPAITAVVCTHTPNYILSTKDTSCWVKASRVHQQRIPAALLL